MPGQTSRSRFAEPIMPSPSMPPPPPPPLGPPPQGPPRSSCPNSSLSFALLLESHIRRQESKQLTVSWIRDFVAGDGGESYDLSQPAVEPPPPIPSSSLSRSSSSSTSAHPSDVGQRPPTISSSHASRQPPPPAFGQSSSQRSRSGSIAQSASPHVNGASHASTSGEAQIGLSESTRSFISSSSTASHPPPTLSRQHSTPRTPSRTLLQQALSLAQQAVLLDQESEFSQALEVYKTTVGLLEQVMVRVEAGERRRRERGQSTVGGAEEEGRTLRGIVSPSLHAERRCDQPPRFTVLISLRGRFSTMPTRRGSLCCLSSWTTKRPFRPRHFHPRSPSRILTNPTPSPPTRPRPTPSDRPTCSLRRKRMKGSVRPCFPAQVPPRPSRVLPTPAPSRR